jgi:hypothetical protein
VPYLLHEAKGWALDVEHLRQQLAAARAQGVAVRGMVVGAGGLTFSLCTVLLTKKSPPPCGYGHAGHAGGRCPCKTWVILGDMGKVPAITVWP